MAMYAFELVQYGRTVKVVPAAVPAVSDDHFRRLDERGTSPLVQAVRRIFPASLAHGHTIRAWWRRSDGWSCTAVVQDVCREDLVEERELHNPWPGPQVWAALGLEYQQRPEVTRPETCQDCGF